MNNEKICINPFTGGKECLELKRKVVFISPYLDTLHSDLYLMSNHNEFKPLVDNFKVLNQIDSLSGQKLPSSFYENLKFKLTDDVKEAEIRLSFTSFFEVDGFRYCIIQISEGKYKEWVVKLKEKEGKIIAKEIPQTLD